MVAILQASTHPNLSVDTLDTQYRRMAGRDGIREDRTGSAFAATLGSSSPTVSIACAGKSLLVDGNLLTFAADAVLDPRDIGTQPTGSQARIDRVVARYDTAVATLKDRGRLAILPGASSTAPTAPTLTRNFNGVFEVPLFRFRFPASGLLSSLVSERVWSGDAVYLESDAGLADLDMPLGSIARRPGVTWHRELVSGSPGWVASGRSVSGSYSGVVPAGFAINVAHGLGVLPRVFTQQATVNNDVVDGISRIIVTAKTVSNFQVVVRRTDGAALAPGNPVAFDWRVEG